MQSIVVALDEPYREWVEDAAGEIKAVTGRKDLARASRPHFVLHVAGRYGNVALVALGRIAAETAPLTVETGEVGIFRGPQVVVAIEVLRSDALLRLQSRIADALVPLADAPRATYATAVWAPHISVVAGHIGDEHVDAVAAVLARRDFRWHIPVTNVCLVPGPLAPAWTRFDVAH